jgi:hypothetical protein
MDEELSKADLALGIAMGAGCGLLIAGCMICGAVYFFPASFNGLSLAYKQFESAITTPNSTRAH